jgi:DNA-directed RNA polymerase specialized sigma24 family protein
VGISEQITAHLKGVVAGDRAAGAWFYDAFADRLFRRLRQRYGYLGEAGVEDVLQDTYLLVLRQEARLLRRFLEKIPEARQTAARLERFLWDQACGLASNQRRSAAHRKVVPLNTVQADRAPNAERETLERDRLARLEHCLSGGRARVFLYYKLRYRDGLSPEQISDATGWSRKATYKLKEALNAALDACVQLLAGAD